MKIYLTHLLFLAGLLSGPSAFAETACWRACTARGYTTKHCAQACGVESDRDRLVCWNYCRGRGGSVSTCSELCAFSSSEPVNPPERPVPEPVTPPEERKPDDGRNGREGAQCRMSSDCPTFSSCENGWCVRGNGEGAECRMSSDCPTFSSCQNGWCVK